MTLRIVPLCATLLLGLAIGFAARPGVPAAAHPVAQVATATSRPATPTVGTPPQAPTFTARPATATPAPTATGAPVSTPAPACLYLPQLQGAP